jgi:hypothetical protein
MVVWGGMEVQNGSIVYSNSGAIYSPASNEWSSLPIPGSLVERTMHTLIWTGSDIVVWGGGNMATGVFNNNGAKLKR